MKRTVPNSMFEAIYAYIRMWRDQRAQRRQSLRQHRLTTKAERKLQRGRFAA